MQQDRLINIGYGNFVPVSRIVSIVNPASSPMKRLREDARSEGRLIDATQEEKPVPSLSLTPTMSSCHPYSPTP